VSRRGSRHRATPPNRPGRDAGDRHAGRVAPNTGVPVVGRMSRCHATALGARCRSTPPASPWVAPTQELGPGGTPRYANDAPAVPSCRGARGRGGRPARERSTAGGLSPYVPGRRRACERKFRRLCGRRAALRRRRTARAAAISVSSVTDGVSHRRRSGRPGFEPPSGTLPAVLPLARVIARTAKVAVCVPA
jgi:hypothetical protein